MYCRGGGSEDRRRLRDRSRMSPLLAEILMKRWEKEKIESERRIRNFKRYVDDSIGIWGGGRMF